MIFSELKELIKHMHIDPDATVYLVIKGQIEELQFLMKEDDDLFLSSNNPEGGY